MDYIPAGVKLSNDVFVKSGNETNIQPAPISSPETPPKHSGKKTRSDWTLWEENKALRGENRALREENKALREECKTLREENKALREECKTLREENKALREENKTLREECKAQQVEIQTLCEDHKILREEKKRFHESLQQALQKDDKPLEGLPNTEDKALQVLEENKSLPVFQEDNVVALKSFPGQVFPEKEKLLPVLQKEEFTVQVLGKEEPAVPETRKAAMAEGNSAPTTLPQGVKGIPEIPEESRSSPFWERSKTPMSLLEENQLSLVFQKLDEIVWFLRENRALLEEKQAFQALEKQNKVLREENRKLKLQHNAGKGVIYKTVGQMNALVQELYALAFRLQIEDELKREQLQGERGGRAEYGPFGHIGSVFSRA